MDTLNQEGHLICFYTVMYYDKEATVKQRLNVTLKSFLKDWGFSKSNWKKNSNLVIWYYAGEVILGLILLHCFINMLTIDMEENINMLPIKFAEDTETRKLINNEDNR